MVDLLMQGNVMQTAMEMVAQDIAQRWKPKTQSDKAIAARQFQAFLKAVGMTEFIFPASEKTPEKTKKQRGAEEDALTAFASHGAMMGQGMEGVGVGKAVNHVRTWHETLFKEELGTVGCKAKAPPTSKHVKAMSVRCPVKDHECKKRRQMMKGLVEVVLTEARRQQRDDVGTAVLTARAGLFRMGELTATEEAHDPVENMAERDMKFLPNSWNANRGDELGKVESRSDRGEIEIETTGASGGRRLDVSEESSTGSVSREAWDSGGTDTIARSITAFSGFDRWSIENERSSCWDAKDDAERRRDVGKGHHGVWNALLQDWGSDSTFSIRGNTRGVQASGRMVEWRVQNMRASATGGPDGICAFNVRVFEKQ
jgi:hypothetical protein